ncbi:MAG: neutral/alkaline non-lysosomal ceramidase N-terminal domain-containing protein [Phycisphaerae bacterium]|nr:neutral/alkaline non-lysosomal ceramidase N-terminal domain-containing protein [Phycisphaerae bacterium]
MSSLNQMSRRDFLDRTLKVGAAGLAASCTRRPAVVAAGADRWQIGCYTRPWAKYDYRMALDAIAEAGFKYAGLMTAKSKTGNLVIAVETTLEEAEQIGEEIRKRGLKVPSVYGGGIPVNKSLKAGIEGLRKLIDNCAACNVGNLLMGGIGNADLYDAYYKAIAECCDYAAEKGMGISVKPHGGLNATGPQCRKTIKMVGHRNFRIWYDPGNIYYYSDGKRDPVTDSATVDGLVVGMCIKDYKHPKNVEVTPGTGMVDFPAVLARLKQGGFTGGPLVIECLEPGDLKHTLAEAKKTREFLEELTGQKTSPSRRASVSTAQLTAGVAVTDITPPVGYRMSGYFHERLSTGTSNPLRAKAVVLRQGDESAALVCCDIIGLSPDVSSRARKLASNETGIPAENILIAATHSHTGPLYFGALRKHLHEKAVATSGSDPYETVDYASRLVRRITRAITKASAAAEPVRLEAGSAEQQGLSFNRRFHMKNGTVRFNPGVLNPDIVRVAGPIDPEVGIVFLRQAETGNNMAALINFALHLDTVGGSLYAADYPFYVEQALRKQYGKDLTLLYGTGTCGDINHIDVTKRERLKTDYIGKTLAETVLAKTESLKAIAEPAMAVRSEIVEVPLQRCGPERIAWAHENIKKVGTEELSFLEQVEAYKILAIEMRASPTIRLEVQVFRLSRDVAVVGLPGEVFVDLGLAIKKASPFEHTLVIELCQDAPGYIPTKKAFAEGSYETVNSRIAPGGGEEMAEAAIRLLKELA